MRTGWMEKTSTHGKRTSREGSQGCPLQPGAKLRKTMGTERASIQRRVVCFPALVSDSAGILTGSAGKSSWESLWHQPLSGGRRGAHLLPAHGQHGAILLRWLLLLIPAPQHVPR